MSSGTARTRRSSGLVSNGIKRPDATSHAPGPAAAPAQTSGLTAERRRRPRRILSPIFLEFWSGFALDRSGGSATVADRIAGPSTRSAPGGGARRSPSRSPRTPRSPPGAEGERQGSRGRSGRGDAAAWATIPRPRRDRQAHPAARPAPSRPTAPRPGAGRRSPRRRTCAAVIHAGIGVLAEPSPELAEPPVHVRPGQAGGEPDESAAGALTPGQAGCPRDRPATASWPPARS